MPPPLDVLPPTNAHAGLHVDVVVRAMLLLLLLHEDVVHELELLLHDLLWHGDVDHGVHCGHGRWRGGYTDLVACCIQVVHNEQHELHGQRDDDDCRLRGDDDDDGMDCKLHGDDILYNTK